MPWGEELLCEELAHQQFGATSQLWWSLVACSTTGGTTNEKSLDFHACSVGSARRIQFDERNRQANNSRPDQIGADPAITRGLEATVSDLNLMRAATGSRWSSMSQRGWRVPSLVRWTANSLLRSRPSAAVSLHKPAGMLGGCCSGLGSRFLRGLWHPSQAVVGHHSLFADVSHSRTASQLFYFLGILAVISGLGLAPLSLLHKIYGHSVWRMFQLPVWHCPLSQMPACGGTEPNRDVCLRFTVVCLLNPSLASIKLHKQITPTWNLTYSHSQKRAAAVVVIITKQGWGTVNSSTRSRLQKMEEGRETVTKTGKDKPSTSQFLCWLLTWAWSGRFLCTDLLKPQGKHNVLGMGFATDSI